MIALPLYERYIIAKLKLAGTETSEDNIKTEIGTDLGLDDRQRSIFWEVFRNGFMHQAMAKDGKTKWAISHNFGALPDFKDLKGVSYILIDPWKFADRVIQHFVKQPELITASDSFPLATIFQLPAELVNQLNDPKGTQQQGA